MLDAGFLLALACVAAIVIVTTLVQSRARKAILPPGPPSIPLLGNGWRVPVQNSCVYFQSLCRKYGPMLTIRGFGQTTLVLDKLEDAQELLVKRSGNYSSRRKSIYAGKYRSEDKRVVMLPYGPELKKQRSAIHTMTNAKAVGSYEHFQDDGSMQMLSNLLSNPTNFYLIIKRFSSETLLRIIYGKHFEENDADMRAVLQIVRTIIVDMHPFEHLVDTMPALDWLPDFLAPWRTKARKKGIYDYELYGRLLREVKQKLDSQEQNDCFVAHLWENQAANGLDEQSMAFVAGSMFEAGTDNTASGILWFLVASMHNPGVVKQAQKEIDQVLGAGGETIPTYEHMAQLPYCLALIKEVLRWAPIAPLSAPHYSMEDDVYKGYYITAGTSVISNLWSIHHDPRLYPEPDAFKPERFLMKKEDIRPESLIEGHYAFGFGRRICPGNHLASKSIWIAIVRIVWAFNISPPLDDKGQPILPVIGACRPGLASEPARFSVSLTPRSQRHIEAIQQGLKDVYVD